MPKITPSILLDPTYNNLIYCLGFYNIHQFNYQIAENGVENTTVFISDTRTQQEYVLRVYKSGTYTNSQIENEIAFIDYLSKHKIPVAEIIPNQAGQKLSQIAIDLKTWQCVLMHKAPGYHLTSYNQQNIQSLANTMAKFHLASFSYQQFTTPPQPYRETLLDTYDFSTLRSDQQAFFQRAHEFQINSQEIPHCLIHTDITRSNTLFENDHITAILDFEGVEHGYCAQDIATTLWGVTRHILNKKADSSLINIFLDSYSSIRPLQQTELQAIPDMLRFRTYVLSAVDLLFEDRASIQEDMEMERAAPEIMQVALR